MAGVVTHIAISLHPWSPTDLWLPAWLLTREDSVTPGTLCRGPRAAAAEAVGEAGARRVAGPGATNIVHHAASIVLATVAAVRVLQAVDLPHVLGSQAKQVTNEPKLSLC